MADQLFQKYYGRIAKEGILKAMLWSLLIACSVLAVTIALSWFFGFKAGLWIGIALFAVAMGIAWPLFYCLKYRPTTKEIAKRVDALGLEERVLTMTELENDSSYIAMKQREDTVNALGKVDHMLVKIAVSVGLIVAVSVTATVGIGAVTTGGLYQAGVIPSGMELIQNSLPVPSYTLEYSVKSGTAGSIVYWVDDFSEEVEFDGKTIVVKEGEEGPRLYATCEEGWHFTGWSDGVKTPYRQDTDVHDKVVAVALFELIDEEEIPADDEVKNDNNDGISNQPGEESAPPSPGSNGVPGDPGDTDGNGPGAGGNSAPNNQIKDGSTYYGDEYGNEYGDAKDRLDTDGELPDDLKGGISDYYGSIEKGGSSEGGSNP